MSLKDRIGRNLLITWVLIFTVKAVQTVIVFTTNEQLLG